MDAEEDRIQVVAKKNENKGVENVFKTAMRNGIDLHEFMDALWQRQCDYQDQSDGFFLNWIKVLMSVDAMPV